MKYISMRERNIIVLSDSIFNSIKDMYDARRGRIWLHAYSITIYCTEAFPINTLLHALYIFRL